MVGKLAMLDSDESKCESSEPATEILMADTAGARHGFSLGKSRGQVEDGQHDREDDIYIPQPPTRERRLELRQRNEHALLTPITGTTLEEIALETAHQATLAEGERLLRTCP
ncbi:hypothetical protein D1007_21634 [Hordeum vulgare]|nr:hypothetical protein D1007_21634 [Hordeum vulgare]